MLSRFTLCAILFAFPLSGWANGILTSIKPIQMITHELTYQVSQPDVLLAANASPHDYAFRPSDVKRIREASLVIWFGPDLEPFLTRALSQHPNVLTLSEIPHLALRAYGEDELHDHHGHSHGSHDPHFWLGVEQVKQVAQAIVEHLVAMDPENSAQYQGNLSRFMTRLDETDQHIAKQLAPVKEQPYYVFHDAYAYFEQHYGLNNLGNFTVSPERRPGAKTLISIRRSLTDHQVKCVFSEPQFQPAVIETVVRGTQVNIGQLDPLGTAIPVQAGSYFEFLQQLSNSFHQCLSQ